LVLISVANISSTSRPSLLALKLGKIFRINPTLWIHIQSKNELTRMGKENKKEYQKYNINDLLKKAS